MDLRYLLNNTKQNNMNKEFIPYEQALALKQLGFDEPCLGFYNHQCQLILMTQEDENSIQVYKNSYVKLGKQYAVPLYQQAFRWLLLLVNKDKHFTNKWTISYNEDYYSLFLGGCNMEVFKAELDCIKYLIEIVKENK